MERCAGIIFKAGPAILFVRRTLDGLWEWPGGHLEEGETALEAAIREGEEETGNLATAPRLLRRTEGNVDYTTFIADTAPFEPMLSDEHSAFVWARYGEYPTPMLQPVAETLALISGHEMDIAKHIAAGLIASPYRYENMWLFDLRITGTGVAYRSALDEYAYRPPENYLSDEFIERCNGMAVIVDHPEKTRLLNAEEYKERNIGAIMYPYRKGDEVWGIAKIYSDSAAMLMQTTHTSTSPGMNFANPAGVQKVTLENGDIISVEGTPSLPDHLAICGLGVWDKGGPPSGINIGDLIMADEKEMKADADDGKQKTETKMDEAPDWAKGMADSVKACMDAVTAMGARMDSLTSMKGDSEKEKADAEEEEKKKADAEKGTAYADTQKALDELRRQMPRELSDDERNAIAEAQARADSVFAGVGKKMPFPMMGEGQLAFRRRLAGILQPLSKSWNGIDLKTLPDPAFANAEAAIYTDAEASARAPLDIAPYELRARTRTSQGGHRITEYSGDCRAWMEAFMPPVKQVINFPRSEVK